MLLGAGLGFWGCGDEREIAVESTSTTAGSTSITGFPDTGVTTPPPTGETTSPETTVFTGGAVPGSQTRALTFLGPVSQNTWRALREIVMSAEDGGQTVLDDVAALAAGPPVDVGTAELDAVSGIGFTAGASTSQPIGVAVDDDGNQVMVFAYTVTGEPDATTIVGFERWTNLVELVEGPLPISNPTGNITTIPSP
jgi:hypothetical protein